MTISPNFASLFPISPIIKQIFLPVLANFCQSSRLADGSLAKGLLPGSVGKPWRLGLLGGMEVRHNYIHTSEVNHLCATPGQILLHSDHCVVDHCQCPVWHSSVFNCWSVSCLSVAPLWFGLCWRSAMFTLNSD